MARFVFASMVRVVAAGSLVAALVLVWTVPAEAAALVDCNANPLALQPAIDAASPGSTLSISGTCLGTFTVSKNLTLKGAPAALDAQGGGTTLTVSSGKVELIGLMITGGTGTDACPPSGGCFQGGGILNFGTLTVTRSTISGNSAPLVGGGIANGGALQGSGTLKIIHSTVSGNTSAFGGGVFSASNSALTVTDSAVSGNAAPGGGGGGIESIGTTLNVTNSSISGNSGGIGGGILCEAGSISHSTVTGNTASSPSGLGGGGIYTNGPLTITKSTVSGNTSALYGGGILNGNGQLIVISSTVSQNTSASVGGGIYTSRFLDVTNSTVSGNSAGSNGGGIFNDFGEVIVDSSTVSGNSSTSNGGGIFTQNSLTLFSTTVSDNSAASGGGIFQDNYGSTKFFASIDAGNPGGDCAGSGAVISEWYNVVGADCGFSSSGDQTVADTARAIGIKPLGGHGGNTQTMPLRRTSPAVDAISIGAVAGDGTQLCPDSGGIDQRGVARPQGSACDVGAYELKP